MFKSVIQATFASVLLLASSFSHAQDVNSKNPYQLVNQLGNQLFEAVTTAKQQEQTSPRQMEALIDDLLMPYIDVPFASYKILGKHLKKTTKEERSMFVEVMGQELKETYSSALAQYNNQSIRYEAVKEVGNKKMIAVKTTLLSPDSNNIDMTFKLRKNRKTQEWKAYDLVVEGISLIDSKRAELAKPLRDKGIQYVTQLVAE